MTKPHLITALRALLIALTATGLVLSSQQPCPTYLTHHYFRHYSQEIEIARTRASQSDLTPALAELFDAFSAYSHRITDPLFEGYYLRGALWSAQSSGDILLASQMLLAEKPALEYYAARMAFFARKYEQSLAQYPGIAPWHGAVSELARFDQGNTRQRGTTLDPKARRLVIHEISQETITQMRHLKLPVSFEPIAGLTFNNARAFTFLEHPWEELWAAQNIFKVERDETLLGYGDPSVRQFYKWFRLKNGRLQRSPPAADYLSLRIRDSQPQLIVRELKFSKPQANVDVPHALEQLQTTIENLKDTISDIPVVQTEIVVPIRSTKLAKGYYYRPQPVTEGKPVYALVNGLDKPIVISVGGETFPVFVRLLPPPP